MLAYCDGIATTYNEDYYNYIMRSNYKVRLCEVDDYIEGYTGKAYYSLDEIRELEEETGINFNPLTLEKVLELDTLYKYYYDYRTARITPRYTKTIYYYVKSNSDINVDKMSLTEGEIKENFKIAFVNINTLFELLSRNHSEARNGQFFDNENRVVMEKVLKPKYFK